MLNMQRRLQQLTIIQHNVRNWSSNKYIYYNAYKSIDPDIILINEHGMRNSNQIKLFNYDTYQTNKKNEKNDGVAIAVKKTIKHRLIDDFIQEFLAVKIETTLGEIIIATTYLPPRRPYLPIIDFQRIMNYNQPTYILGDFNARHRLFGHKDNNDVGKSLVNFINRGKICHIGPQFPTFLGTHNITSPDKVFSNNKAFLNYHLSPGPLTPSDHIPIIMKISVNHIQVPIRKRLNMKKANWEKFREELENTEVPNLQEEPIEELDNAISKFHTNIKNAMENHIPTTTYKTLPSITVSENLRRLQVQYNHLYNYIQTNGPSIQLMNRIKQLKQLLQTIYLEKKTQHWDNIIKNINESSDPNSFWKQINQLKGKSNINIPYVKDINGDKIYDDKSKSKAFRNIWSGVFKISEEENEQFDEEHENNIKDWMSEHLDEATPLPIINTSRLTEREKITELELLHNLRKFKEKSPGLSGITRNILMNLPQKGIHTLLNIYNASLSTGYFPDDLKKAKMIFIPKEGKDTKNITNYRPISLLEVTGKLLEKIINNRLLDFLEHNNIINKRQHGFRKKRGTHTALALITENIALSKAKKHNINIVLRDISKAFDKVWHLGLKYKVLNTNIPSYMKRMLCDYLEDREVFIQIGSYIEKPFTIESGVPQGGCLSPTLFILYTSDMPDPAPCSEYVMFADDITQIISYPGKSKELTARHTARAIESINKYENKWKIQTNINKFKVIPIGKLNPAPLLVEGDVYQYTNEGIVLGLKITKTGYKTFIKEKLIRLRNTLTKLKELNSLSTANKRKLYLALVRSIIEYPPIPLHAMKKTNIYELQKIQNKALRFIFNIGYPEVISNEELHARAELPTIEELLNERARSIWSKINTHHLYLDLHDIQDREELQDNERFPISKLKL